MFVSAQKTASSSPANSSECERTSPSCCPDFKESKSSASASNEKRPNKSHHRPRLSCTEMTVRDSYISEHHTSPARLLSRKSKRPLALQECSTSTAKNSKFKTFSKLFQKERLFKTFSRPGKLNYKIQTFSRLPNFAANPVQHHRQRRQQYLPQYQRDPQEQLRITP